MTLQEIYTIKSDEELIEILEKKFDYSREVVDIVEAEFTRRNLNSEFVIKHAKLIYSTIVNHVILNNGLTDIDYVFPKSHFLSESQMNKIIRSQFGHRIELLETTKDGARRFQKKN